MAGTVSDLAGAVKAALTMEEVAQAYGFGLSRGGFIQCPFHEGDRHGSLKLYPEDRGWHCFGCGAGGSVIDFVMLLFDLPFKEAAAKLNTDFGLGLSSDRPSRAEMSRLARWRQEEQRRREELRAQELALFDRECRLCAEIDRAALAMSEHPPTLSDGVPEYPAAYVAAVRRLDKLRWALYQNDCETAQLRRQKEVIEHKRREQKRAGVRAG